MVRIKGLSGPVGFRIGMASYLQAFEPRELGAGAGGWQFASHLINSFPWPTSLARGHGAMGSCSDQALLAP